MTHPLAEEWNRASDSLSMTRVGQRMAVELDALAAENERLNMEIQRLRHGLNQIAAENERMRKALEEGVAIFESDPSVGNAIRIMDRFRAEVKEKPNG